MTEEMFAVMVQPYIYICCIVVSPAVREQAAGDGGDVRGDGAALYIYIYVVSLYPQLCESKPQVTEEMFAVMVQPYIYICCIVVSPAVREQAAGDGGDVRGDGAALYIYMLYRCIPSCAREPCIYICCIVVSPAVREQAAGDGGDVRGDGAALYIYMLYRCIPSCAREPCIYICCIVVSPAVREQAAGDRGDVRGDGAEGQGRPAPAPPAATAAAGGGAPQALPARGGGGSHQAGGRRHQGGGGGGWRQGGGCGREFGQTNGGGGHAARLCGIYPFHVF